MIRLGISVFSLLIFSTLCQAQTRTLDSLKNELNSSNSDSIRLDILSEISASLYRYDPDSALVYGSRNRELAEKLDDKEKLAYALKSIGLAYYMKSDFPLVMSYWEKSLDVFKSINHLSGISNLLNNIGAVYYNKGYYPKALENYYESLEYAQLANDTNRLATVYVNIGSVYSENDETLDQAEEMLLRAFKLHSDLGISSSSAVTAINLGDIYIRKKDPIKALSFLNQSIGFIKESGGVNISSAYNLIGRAHHLNGDMQEAIQFQKLAIQSAQERNSILEIVIARNSLAKNYLEEKLYQQSILESTKAMELGLDIEANAELILAYKGLAAGYANIGDFERAFNYQTKFDDLKEKISEEKYGEQIASLRFQQDMVNKEKEIELLNLDKDIQEAELEKVTLLRNFLYAIGGFFLVIIAGISFQFYYVKKSNRIISKERNRSESILLNILPKSTADELKVKGFVDAQKCDSVTVLFTDFKSFTSLAEVVSAEVLVSSVDYYFKKFDDIIEDYNLEKIKTIGDAYMCAGGVPTSNKTHANDAVAAALDIIHFVKMTKQYPPEGIITFDIRIGLNTGPVVAGVVGNKKFQYDIWGESVNTASRMESGSEPGRINISENTYQVVKDRYDCTFRGEIAVKNGKKLKMYFVDQAKAVIINNKSEITLTEIT